MSCREGGGLWPRVDWGKHTVRNERAPWYRGPARLSSRVFRVFPNLPLHPPNPPPPFRSGTFR